MSKKIGTIIGVAVAALAVVGLVAAFSNSKPTLVEEYPSYDQVKERAAAIDMSPYDPTKVTEPNADNGNNKENIEGDLSKAKVVIFEYADYQCSYCSYFNPTVNSVLNDYGDDVAVVFRTYLLEYHNNGVQAALAAEAAGRQGYWQEFKDVLFSEQDNWANSSRTKFQKQVEDYFLQVAGQFADLDKFREDMRDDALLQKIAFTMAMGMKIELPGTPYFYIDGERVDIKELHDKVGELLGR